MELTVHLCLVPRLSVSGALPSLAICASMEWTRETFTSFLYGMCEWSASHVHVCYVLLIVSI